MHSELAGTEGADVSLLVTRQPTVGFFPDGKLKKIPSTEAGRSMSALPAVVRTAAEQHGIRTTSSYSSRPPVTRSKCRPLVERQRQSQHYRAGTESHRWPAFLPEGDIFSSSHSGKNSRQLRVGSLTSTASTPVGSIRTMHCMQSGHLLFVDDTLMAQPFDLRTRQLTGEPIPLNARVAVCRRARHSSRCPTTKLLAYREPVQNESQLTWMDRKGNPVGSVGEPG